MSSINFNSAANSALRTLQQSNKSLDATQARISSGLKIGEAKDNAAYWSITTTLKSDNKALSTVSDALGLGAATVDTAYQGLNETVNVLNEIKSKITAASQDGVDKKAVQAEISELQKQLQSIANASTFSGENWLSVNSGATGYNPEKNIVSAMDRDSNNVVTLSTIKIDTTNIALINADATKAGILDAGKVGNAEAGGLASMTTASTGTVDVAAEKAFITFAAFTYTPASGGSVAGDTKLDATFKVDGTDYVLSLTDSADFDTLAELKTAIENAETAANVKLSTVADVAIVDNKIVLTNKVGGVGKTLEVTGFALTADTTATTPATFTGVADNASVDGVDAIAFEAATATMGTAFTTDIELDADDKLSFSLTVDGGTATSVVIDRDTVIAALPSSEGKITSAADYATVISKAIEKAGLQAKVGATADGTDHIVFTSKATTGETSVQLAGFGASKGVNVLTLDVSTATRDELSTFLEGLNKAIDNVTSAAATLGAVGARVDLQKSFVQNLMDTIEKGVSGLIDADMNEESTKLQALQVKQSLGVQALSIANQSAQNVLRLFQ